MADTRFSHLFIPSPSDSRNDYRSPRRGGDGPRLRAQDRPAHAEQVRHALEMAWKDACERQAGIRLLNVQTDHLDGQGNLTKLVPLAPLIEDIFSRLQVRNAIGCHFKELAGHFNEIGEALALGKATLALVAAICDDKDTLPDRRKDGCSWHNRGERVTRRLYPLLKPE